MSREEEERNRRLFDRRVVERNIKKGLTTRKDYEKHLKSLADTGNNVVPPGQLPDEAPDADGDSAN